MSTLDELHERWSREPEYREAYERLAPEFELVRALIEAGGHVPGGAGREDGNDAIGGGPLGERPGTAIDADS